ncbi:DUF4265 domain-containing protein [Cryobacterium sp. MDB2-33-2]|nr:DUF4265 domain-containing protein [Cryobacterium sp. MDB2-33-2]
MDEYRQHPSKVARWDDGGLVPIVEGTADPVTVWVALPPENGRQYWEGMNAWSVSDGVVELRAVPAFACNLNFGDRLSTVKSAEGSLVCTGIVQPSDQWTYRVWLSDEASATWHLVAENYARAGCLVDVMSQHLIAISCDYEVARIIADKLAADERTGILTYETGRS